MTSYATVIRGLYPAHPYKAIERALNCSPRQAQRIVETGQVPAKWRDTVVAFLRSSADYNRRRLAEIEAEIARLEAQTAANAATDMGGDP